MIYSIFIIPLLILVIGFLMYKYPPKKPNWLVGYRTRRSMKDMKVWEISNRFCGKVWIIIGLIMLSITALMCLLSCFKIIIFNEKQLLILIFCEIGLLLLSTLMVENKIKKNPKMICVCCDSK